MSVPHIADGETTFTVINVTPDFCKVEGKVVPFEISRDLSHERDDYARTFHARGKRVLKVGSVIEGVVGNMGQGVNSGVSLGSGNVLTLRGSATFHVERQPVVRHGDLVGMNVK